MVPVRLAPGATTNGLPAGRLGTVQSSVKVTLPLNSCEGMFAFVRESSGMVATAPPAKTGAIAAFCTL